MGSRSRIVSTSVGPFGAYYGVGFRGVSVEGAPIRPMLELPPSITGVTMAQNAMRPTMNQFLSPK